MVSRTAWRQATPYLIFNAIVYFQGALLFGIDTGSFGSLQALPSFLNRFGERNPATGAMFLPTKRKSLMNSVPWIGKIAGCIAVEPLIERCGYKKSMYVVAIMQILSLIIEMTSKEWIQFTVGRNFAYFTVGLVENVVPSYNSETAPAALRGFFAGSITVLVALGNLWGAGMSRAYIHEQRDIGWLVPCGVQLLPAVLMLILVPFTPESPRWLVLRGRKDVALTNLNKIRRKEDVANGYTSAEIETIEEAIELESHRNAGTWLDLFRGNYLRRSWIAGSLFAFQQTNGNQFVNSYGPTFYKQQGYGDASFTYSTLGQMMTVFGTLFGITFTDRWGRRPLMISGGLLSAIFLFIASGLGDQDNKSAASRQAIIAMFLLLGATTKFSASNNAFIVGAEIGGTKMRKKTLAFGTSMDVVAAFLVTFVTPYLLANPGPNLSANIGFIFGGAAFLSFLFGVFYLPELAGRSLEEIDELFEANLWAWQFKKYQTTGVGRRLTQLENHEADTGAVSNPAARGQKSIIAGEKIEGEEEHTK